MLGRQRVVVKVAPAGMEPVRNRDVLRQARLLKALQPTAVPVPAVLLEDAGAPPAVPPFFVMTFIDGTSLEPLFDRDGDEEDAVIAERMRGAALAMASLHALRPDALGLADEPIVSLSDEIERWCRALETVDPALAPGWESVAGGLRATMPPALPPAIVHGDLRLGNMLAVGPRVEAIIDWELWSIGDPRVDAGWFLINADPETYQRSTRYGDAPPSPDELAAIYGEVPDLDWFQALACFKSTATWSLIVKHNRRRSTPDPAMEEVAGVLPHLLERAADLSRPPSE